MLRSEPKRAEPIALIHPMEIALENRPQSLRAHDLISLDDGELL